MSSRKYWKCYFGCETDGVLHRFPNPLHNEERFILWTRVLDSETQKKDGQYVYNNLRLCDEHFELCYRTPSRKLTRNAVPTLNLASSQAPNRLSLMDVSILSQSSLHDPENSASVSASLETNQSLLQSEVLENLVPYSLQDKPADISINVTGKNAVPSTSKDIAQSTTSSQAPNRLSLMDVSILSQSSLHDPENSASVSASLETNQSLLQSEVLENLVPYSLQDKPADISINVTGKNAVPSTSKDIAQSTTTYKAYKQTQRKVYKLEQKLKKLSQKFISQNKKIKCAKNLSHSKQFLKLIETFPEPMQVFSKLQMKMKFKPRGRRYTMEEKVLALSIFKQSAKAYNILKKMFVLPSKRCLQKQLSLIPLEPGINELVFKHLTKTVKRLPLEKRLCTLLFDEVALEPGLHFNKGQIIGFEDYGFKNSNIIADHALVFMLKSIKGKFKQPICYTFCQSCTKKEDLKYLIKLIIQEIHKTGLKVIATICDQSQSNVSVIRTLREDTRRDYLRKEMEHRSCSFEIDNIKIFPLFDTPHLLKGVRNNLLKKDAKFVQNGIEKTARWEHLKMLLNEDVGEYELRLVNKLTESHIYENKMSKMKVKYAAQVFSQRVSSAMRFLARHKILPAECEETAEFLLIFDKLFDSFNGHTYSGTTKELTGCLKHSSPHIKFWNEVLPLLKSIEFKTIIKNKDGTEKVKYEKIPSITNWVNNIETFMEMWEMLKGEHKVYNLLTRNFNQDPLENFFCCICSNGVRNTNPTCAQFINAYKTLLVNNLSSPHSVNANCEADNNKSLQSLTHLLEYRVEPQEENITFNIDNLMENLTNIACGDQDQHNIIHKESKRYVAGYIVNKCQKKIFKSCKTCKSNFFNNEIDPATYTYYRDYTKKSLVYAKEEFIELTSKIYEIIILCLRDSPQERKLKEKIMLFTDIDINFNILTCELHKCLLKQTILNIAINIIVHSWCKGVNNLLKGKLEKFDESDNVKVQARSYFLKRRKK